MKIVTVVQARTGSSRLPEKVMMDVCGAPLLIRMLERVAASKHKGLLVVATSTESEDDPIEKLCLDYGYECYRGSLNDLLDRHYKAALKYNADAVVKIPSDCPLIDPEVIDKVLLHFINNQPEADFVSNLHPPSWPDGNDVEIMKMSVLETAWREAERKLEREHTTPFIWENPERFNIKSVLWERGLDYSSSHRWTIDYIEDYHFIKTVYEKLYTANPLFSCDDILSLLDKEPQIAGLNDKYAGDYWYLNHFDELKNIDEYKEKRQQAKEKN